uniref:Uncharacterized protein n=1 Tax=Astatotilapia calliptera TaxID=8154 RepID=A0A3P8P521_ASTCA
QTNRQTNQILVTISQIFNIRAPRTAVYKFMRCNPDGDQANCVTQQSPEMEWSPDLPSKLPASAADIHILKMCIPWRSELPSAQNIKTLPKKLYFMV